MNEFEKVEKAASHSRINKNPPKIPTNPNGNQETLTNTNCGEKIKKQKENNFENLKKQAKRNKVRREGEEAEARITRSYHKIQNILRERSVLSEKLEKNLEQIMALKKKTPVNDGIDVTSLRKNMERHMQRFHQLLDENEEKSVTKYLAENCDCKGPEGNWEGIKAPWKEKMLKTYENYDSNLQERLHKEMLENIDSNFEKKHKEKTVEINENSKQEDSRNRCFDKPNPEIVENIKDTAKDKNDKYELNKEEEFKTLINNSLLKEFRQKQEFLKNFHEKLLNDHKMPDFNFTSTSNVEEKPNLNKETLITNQENILSDLVDDEEVKLVQNIKNKVRKEFDEAKNKLVEQRKKIINDAKDKLLNEKRHILNDANDKLMDERRKILKRVNENTNNEMNYVNDQLLNEKKQILYKARDKLMNEKEQIINEARN